MMKKKAKIFTIIFGIAICSFALLKVTQKACKIDIDEIFTSLNDY